MRSAVQSDIAKYERALNRYYQTSASQRKTKDREKILKILGVDNPQEFLSMHIPLWEVKIDELLDPSSTDMLPISISHSYVNWVRGAIRLMPDIARVKIFSSKLKATGLKKAILTLLTRIAEDAPRDFEVTDVQLVEKVHKDTLISVRDPQGKEYSLYLSRFGCLGEYIHSGLPGLVGLPVLPVVYHLTPQGEEILLKPKEEGVNIYLDEGVTVSRILREWGWWVEGAARQDALGDCIGTALRFGHYVAAPGKKVIMIDNIELFHVFPDNQRKREDLLEKMQTDYDKAYRDQMRILAREWGEMERYLIQMRRHIRTYTGEVFEKVLRNVKARVFGKR
jgi:hypothetical protein